MVKENFQWLMENLEVSKEMNDIKIYTEADAFRNFMGYVDINVYELPYLSVIYIYEYLYDTFDGDNLYIYNIYIITTTAYLPQKEFSQEEKEKLLEFVKSLCNL